MADEPGKDAALMARNSEKRGGSKRKIIAVILAVIGGWWCCSIQANLVAHRSVALAFPDWDIYYGNISIRPWGGAWISDVDMIPLNGNEEESYHFDKVSVEIPFLQFYRSAYAYDLLERIPAVKDVTLHLEGGSGSMAWPFSRELSLFGTTSASPFEAEGCAEDGSWNSDELPAMGLDAKPTRLTMAWHEESDRIVKQQSIETPGVGRVDYRAELLRRDKKSLLSLAGGDDDELALSEWHVVDEGFVAARNKFCATRDGISTAEFTERHLATVQRVLAAIGMEARESTLSSYRHFVEHGGNLDIVVNYSPTIDAAVYNDDDWSRWLARAQAQLSVQGRNTALSVRAIDVRPFPESDQIRSTWDIVRQEQERQTASIAAATSPEMPASTASGAVALAAPTIAVATSSSAISDEDILYVEDAQDAEVEERPKTIVDYNKLAGEVGERFMFHLKGKPAMRVEVVGIDEGVIKVRRYLRSGWLEQGITRTAFERADRVR
jgi:hypothetical protein